MSKLRTNKSGIESFVKFYLAKLKNVNNLRIERRFMDKAIQQIDFFLNSPCCDDPDTVIEFSRFNNELTRYIAAQFKTESFEKRRYRKSLVRARKALNDFLNRPCCDLP